MSVQLRLLITPAAALLLCLSIDVSQAEPPATEPAEPPVTLHVGDAAPALKPGKWLKGEPVAALEKDKVYVVEFWATWCGPCKASIPHLTELQKKFPKVTFIGQDCMEQKPESVEEFVKKMGDKMDYRVALDDVGEKKEPSADDPGIMAKSWLMAAGQGGIPTAFVVDTGSKIAWIGHPMELEEVLPAVTAGTFDAKKFAAEQARKQAEWKKFAGLLGAKKYDEAFAMMDNLAKETPSRAPMLVGLRFHLLLEKKDYAAASAMGPKVLETFKDEPDQLNELAWHIVGPETKVEKPDLDLAEKLAARAVEASQGKNGGALDTLARVYSLQGNLDKAIETQTKALQGADGEQRDEVKKTLEEYKAAKEKADKK